MNPEDFVASLSHEKTLNPTKTIKIIKTIEVFGQGNCAQHNKCDEKTAIFVRFPFTYHLRKINPHSRMPFVHVALICGKGLLLGGSVLIKKKASRSEWKGTLTSEYGDDGNDTVCYICTDIVVTVEDLTVTGQKKGTDDVTVTVEDTSGGTQSIDTTLNTIP